MGFRDVLAIDAAGVMLCGIHEMSELAMQRVWYVGTMSYQRRSGCLCGGYKDVCIIDAAGGCAGVQRQTVLATQWLCISL